MHSRPGFFEYFVEQELYEVLALAVLAAVVYGVSVATAARLGRARGAAWAPPAALATTAGLATWAIGLTLFEASALYWRYQPPGSGAQRDGRALDRFYTGAGVAFASLYALVVVVACLTAAALSRRQERPGTAVVAAAAATALFLGLTLPPVEFQNACDVGRPLVVARFGNC